MANSKYLLLILSMLVALAIWLALPTGWFTGIPDFPVEELAHAPGGTRLIEGTLIPEERVSVHASIREHTWKAIRRVIVDSRKEEHHTAFAFVGRDKGTVYVLEPGGLDSWVVVRQETWSVEPLAAVLRITASP